MRKAALIVAAIAATVAAAGCGGSSSGTTATGASTTAGASRPATLAVGYIPIADCAPLFVGIKKGFFAEQNLTIKPHPAAGGAAIIPAVASGDQPIGFSNTVSTLLAVSKGLPLKSVGMGAQTGADRKHNYDAIVVAKGSPIKSVKDLQGKTVSVNTLKNIGTLTIANVLRSNGVDPSSVKFTELEFPDAPAALAKGQVDATWVVEPFRSVEQAAGGRVIAQPFVDTHPNLAVAEWVTTTKYMDSNRDVVDRFHTAITKADVYAQAHPAYVRKVLLDYTKIPPKAARSMILPTWAPQSDLASVELLDKLAVKDGYYDKPVDVKATFPFAS